MLTDYESAEGFIESPVWTDSKFNALGCQTCSGAEVLGVSAITVKRHWRMAKAWLSGQLVSEYY